MCAPAEHVVLDWNTLVPKLISFFEERLIRSSYDVLVLWMDIRWKVGWMVDGKSEMVGKRGMHV